MAHLRKIVSVIWFCFSSSVFAAESPEASYGAMATDLFQSLPKNSTVAIQPLSEEETKIPATILRSIEVGLTSALQRGSDFEVKLIARDRLQTIWKEAREFSNKKFEDMVAEAGAEVLLIGEVRPNSDGIEISYRAFRVKGAGTGNVIASSKPRIMAMDWKKELGAAPTQIADTMKEMAEAMKRLAASGGLVSNPKTPVEFYHNARVLGQRGESDLALEAYNHVFQDRGLRIIDPVIDAVDISRKLYGSEASVSYVEKKIKPFVSEEVALLAAQLVADKPLVQIEHGINDGGITFPPLLAAFVNSTAAATKFTSSTGVLGMPYGTRMAVYRAAEAVVAANKSGVLQSSFLDLFKASQVATASLSVVALDIDVNRFFYRHGVNAQYSFDRTLIGYKVKPNSRLQISDSSIDQKAGINVCYIDITRAKRCIQPLLSGADFKKDFFGASLENITFELGKQPFLCLVEVSWSDTRGGYFKIGARELNELRYTPAGGSSFVQSELEKANALTFFQDCLFGIAKSDEELQAENTVKEAFALKELQAERLAETNASGASNEEELKLYVQSQRNFKRFLQQELSAGSVNEVDKASTLRDLAGEYLNLWGEISKLSRSDFHELTKKSFEELKWKCKVISMDSIISEKKFDRNGVCVPLRDETKVAQIDPRNSTEVFLFETKKLKLSALDPEFGEPRELSGSDGTRSAVTGNSRSEISDNSLSRDQEWSQKKGWRTYKSASFNGCVTRSTYKDGTDVIFGYSPKLSGLFVSFLNAKWKRVQIDNPQQVNFVLSNGDKFRGEFKTFTNDSGVVIQSGVNRKFIGVLASARWFKMSAQGFELADLSLEGSRDAITSVEQCQEDLEDGGSKANQINSSGSDDEAKPKKPAPKQNGSAPVPDPLSIMRALTGGGKF